MHKSPSSEELLSAVIAFLDNVAVPALSGHAQFSARVSARTLALVGREMATREAADANARRVYADLLGQPDTGDLSSLEAQLCAAIKAGDITPDTPSAMAAIRAVATAQLMIDQPTYSGLGL